MVALQQLDGNIIGPKVLGNKIGLSSFWVLFSILVCGSLFGIVGMIIGVPLFAVMFDIITAIVDSRLKSKNMPTDKEYYSMHITASILFSPVPTQMSIPSQSMEDVLFRYP